VALTAAFSAAASVWTMNDSLQDSPNGGTAGGVPALHPALQHAAHRMFHMLHDLGVHAGMGTRMLCYGTALIGTITAAIALLSIGF
jgi:hypothetical protein